ncbi:hypothetical protein D3C87_1311540 [compost metagenome]
MLRILPLGLVVCDVLACAVVKGFPFGPSQLGRGLGGALVGQRITALGEHAPTFLRFSARQLQADLGVAA